MLAGDDTVGNFKIPEENSQRSKRPPHPQPADAKQKSLGILKFSNLEFLNLKFLILEFPKLEFLRFKILGILDFE